MKEDGSLANSYEYDIFGNIIKEIETTPTYPFWVEGKGWTYARELKSGDKLRLNSGEIVTIQKVETEHLGKIIDVYNFEVEDWHTYFVSDKAVLVHNQCFQTPSQGAAKAVNTVEKTTNLNTTHSLTMGK